MTTPMPAWRKTTRARRSMIRRQVVARARAAGYVGAGERLRDVDRWAVRTAESSEATFLQKTAAASIHRYILGLG